MPLEAKPESIDDETGLVPATKPLIVYEDDLKDLDEPHTVKILEEAQPDSIEAEVDLVPVAIQPD